MQRAHLDTLAAVSWLMAVFALVLLLMVQCGCGGSRFLEAPTNNEPDTSDCGELKRQFSGSTPWSPVAVPFNGTRTVKMWARVPGGWDDFGGTIHIMSAEWAITWVRSMKVQVGPYPRVAVWDGSDWDTDPRVDIRPHLELQGDYLVVEPTFTARGTKPAGKQTVPIGLTFAVCGPGADGLR